MVKHMLVNCLLLFLCIFLMCPKRSRMQTTSALQQFNIMNRRIKYPYYHPWSGNGYKMSGVQNNSKMELKRTKWWWPKLFPDWIGKKEDKTEALSLSDSQITQLKLWPTGVIPYFIDDVSYSDKVLRDRIRLVLNEVNSETGVNFMEMASPPSKEDKMRWVFFVNRAAQLGCGDHSTRDTDVEGVLKVRLGYDCMSTGNEIAEAVLSIVGIPPQHNAPNRDKYITIHKENIIPEKQYLFEKVSDQQWPFSKLEYDFASSSHYHNHKYSANGKATITVKDNETDVILGVTHGFSYLDIQKIRMVYNNIAKSNKAPECEKLFDRNIFPKRVKMDKSTNIGYADNSENHNHDVSSDNMPGLVDKGIDFPNHNNNGDEVSAHDDKLKDSDNEENNSKPLTERNINQHSGRQTLEGRLTKDVSLSSDYYTEYEKHENHKSKPMKRLQGVRYLKYKRSEQPR